MDKPLHASVISKIIRNNDLHTVDQLSLSEKTDLLISIVRNYAYKDSPIFDYLLEQKINLNYVDISEPFPISLLGYAAEKGSLHFCNKLLDNGAKLETANNVCILLALSAGQLDVLKLFVSRGFDIHSIESITIAPSGKGHVHILKYLLEDCHIKVHHKGIDLLNASQHGRLDAVKYLIKQGADPLIKDGFDENSMMVAAAEDHLPIVQYLISEGYDAKDALFNRASDNVKSWITAYLKSKALYEQLENTLIHKETNTNHRKINKKKVKI